MSHVNLGFLRENFDAANGGLHERSIFKGGSRSVKIKKSVLSQKKRSNDALDLLLVWWINIPLLCVFDCRFVQMLHEFMYNDQYLMNSWRK